MNDRHLTRRQALAGAAGLGLTVELLATNVIADAAAARRKMVVII